MNLLAIFAQVNSVVASTPSKPVVTETSISLDLFEKGGFDDSNHDISRARKAGTVTGAVFQNSGRGLWRRVDRAHRRRRQGRPARRSCHPAQGDARPRRQDRAGEVAVDKRDFEGKSLESPPAEQWAVKKDGGVFDQFAGATITPRLPSSRRSRKA